jgi:hypothetical protein
MEKVILLVFLMPYLASGQFIELSGQNPYIPVAGDVIISEIMADPLPVVALPGKEYIELFNRCNSPVSIKGWKLLSGESVVILPDVIIQPSEYLVICHEDNVSLFTGYGRVAGAGKFPVLTDDGKLLCIQDASGKLIHGVEYSSDWYGDVIKAEGGWSLEIIDTGFPFYAKGNWRASASKTGGTPGSANSVSGKNPDNFFNGITNAFPMQTNELLVSFSEPVISLNTDINKTTVSREPVKGIIPDDPLYRQFRITPLNPLIEGRSYNIEVSDIINDFAGNRMRIKNFLFGIPVTARAGDIRFNEILFNPLPGDADYLELFNTSERIVDASKLFLVSVNSYGDTSKMYPLSDERRCIMPGNYYAVTTDKEKILKRYPLADQDYLFELQSLPSMNDDEGHLMLLTRELDIIDELRYNEDMHFSLLSGHEGIALEKTGPVNNSLDESSWHSATESAGWGTPGRRNSVCTDLVAEAGTISLSSSKISPDSDGFEDFLSVHLSLPELGNVASLYVFDENGSLIRRIASNMLIGSEADIIWDGTADDGNLVNRGIYIILVSVYNDKGKTWQWKKACAVLRR